jgi:hypothetical protein
VRAVEWRPKQPVPTGPEASPFEPAPSSVAGGATARVDQEESDHAPPSVRSEQRPVRAVRLFAYGDPSARAKVRAKITDWDDEFDWLVA